MNFTENVRIALQSIKGNRLRASLTALIIAIGISALVGILTTLDAVERSMTKAFSSMGANSFNIRNRGTGIRIGGQGQRPKVFRSIRYEEALHFKQNLKTPATVSVSVFASGGSTIKYGSLKTNPNINVQGLDENGLAAQGLNIEQGRNFSLSDIDLGNNVCVVGSEVVKRLFKDEDPLDKMIKVGDNRFKIIGVLESKGSSMGFSGDRGVYIPLLKAKQINSNANPSYVITVMVPSNEMTERIIGESTALLRNIRKVKVTEDNNFEVTKSDAVAQMLMTQLSTLVIAFVAIGVITLIGASIALMNIMLVSVTERTREIGVRKAIGANPSLIRKQFLIEAIIICLMGGILGIILGVMIGNIISLVMGGSFILPIFFVLGGLLLCIGVGTISGYYPASKASKLDPVEALRYE